MVRLRETYIEDGYNLPDAGTRITDINIVDPIQDLCVIFEGTNGGTSNIENYIFDIVDQIEVIDGSDVLFSLKPKEILALNAYHYKESLGWGIDERADEIQRCTFKIPFGLGRFDPNIALDPTQHMNPQLRVTWDIANIRAAGATGFLANNLFLTVIATIAEKATVRPTSFLQTKHTYEWETAAAGEEVIEMPVDYPHRTVFMRVNELQDSDGKYKEGSAYPNTVLTDGKYSVDQDKYIPFDFHTDDWREWLKEWYGFWHQGEYFTFATPTNMCRHNFLPGNQAIAFLGINTAGDEIWSAGTGCMKCMSAGTAVASLTIHQKADGTLPFSTWAYPFGDPLQREEWLQISDIKNIKFRIEQAVAGYLGQVFLTQERSY